VYIRADSFQGIDIAAFRGKSIVIHGKDVETGKDVTLMIDVGQRRKAYITIQGVEVVDDCKDDGK
jgi:hypothetical protein